MLRKILSIVCVVLFLLFAYITLTVPMISAAAPAILTLGFGAVAWFLWPKHHHSEGVQN